MHTDSLERNKILMFCFLCRTGIKNAELREEVKELHVPLRVTGGNIATGQGIHVRSRSRPYNTVH